ncbi:hypothetical protein HUN08_13995 [Gordonia sp. X0973]|uniref:hypothetical protein n=1 Tax=Gordonia sp. X0973 TaxID=2742602 RepID=UPI0013EDCD16|nr:hypothetical protein [Gordonia sp. X0973]QKT08181.1 hypothetical protein HUN08_13995 [Gordonia sp. X0973]
MPGPVPTTMALGRTIASGAPAPGTFGAIGGMVPLQPACRVSVRMAQCHLPDGETK